MKRKYRLVLAVMTVTLALASLTMMTGETVAKEPQKKCLELPAGYSMEDFKAALQLGRELRIKQRLPKCSEFSSGLQPSMKAAGKCWNPDCSKIVDGDIRAAVGCSKPQNKEIHVRAGPNAGNIVKRLEGKGFSCSERPSRPGDYTCIKLQKGVCDGKVAPEALEKCNKKCGQIKDSEEREECIVDFQ